MRRICSVIFVALMVLAENAVAQMGPTDVELKAAYCLGVTRITQQVSSSAWASIQAAHQDNLPLAAPIRQNLAEQNDRLDRLRAYVLPKLMADQSSRSQLPRSAERTTRCNCKVRRSCNADRNVSYLAKTYPTS
jgi:hypothetical protein